MRDSKGADVTGAEQGKEEEEQMRPERQLVPNPQGLPGRGKNSDGGRQGFK